VNGGAARATCALRRAAFPPSAGPPPLPPGQDRRGDRGGPSRDKDGVVSLDGRRVMAAEILAGRQVGVRIDGPVRLFYGPGHPPAVAHPPQPANS
jgi:hypothetical protein